MAGTAPLVASTIPLYLFKNGINPRTFQTLLGLSAGLLFAIATLELIPEAFEMIELANTQYAQSNERDILTEPIPPYSETENLATGVDDDDHDHGGEANAKIGMLGFGAGYIFLVILEQVMSGGHGHSHSHSMPHSDKHDDDEIEKV